MWVHFLLPSPHISSCILQTPAANQFWTDTELGSAALCSLAMRGGALECSQAPGLH